MVEGDFSTRVSKITSQSQETGNTEGASSSTLLEQLPEYTPDKELVLWLGCFAKHAMDPNFVKSVENFTKIPFIQLVLHMESLAMNNVQEIQQTN
ncbi:MAG: hypothetical protein CM1200mP31_4350 [Candidatus Neomarinimicrobiota bacterium]|nr:MAG: hypothetical protein CM1200mP31_4350 [Candidatus Neomarinimicrobiota bacterium]